MGSANAKTFTGHANVRSIDPGDVKASFDEDEDAEDIDDECGDWDDLKDEGGSDDEGDGGGGKSGNKNKSTKSEKKKKASKPMENARSKQHTGIQQSYVRAVQERVQK